MSDKFSSKSQYFFQDIKSDNLNNYKNKQNSLYNIINKHGYRVFELSKETKDVMKLYGLSKFYKDLRKKSKVLNGLVKSYDFENDDIIYSDFRCHKTFYRLENLKALFKENHRVYKIVVLIINDIKQIYDLKDWVTISINFLISLAKPKDGDIQDYHTDYDYIPNDSPFKINNNYPFSIIVTMFEFSYFRFLMNSHKKFTDNKNGRLDPKAIFNEKILKLKFGQFIIFHPNLIHSGIIGNS